MSSIHPKWCKSSAINSIVREISHCYLTTLPETNSSHLKLDGWKTILSFWEGNFSGRTVSFREGSYTLDLPPHKATNITRNITFLVGNPSKPFHLWLLLKTARLSNKAPEPQNWMQLNLSYQTSISMKSCEWDFSIISSMILTEHFIYLLLPNCIHTWKMHLLSTPTSDKWSYIPPKMILKWTYK